MLSVHSLWTIVDTSSYILIAAHNVRCSDLSKDQKMRNLSLNEIFHFSGVDSTRWKPCEMQLKYFCCSWDNAHWSPCVSSAVNNVISFIKNDGASAGDSYSDVYEDGGGGGMLLFVPEW